MRREQNEDTGPIDSQDWAGQPNSSKIETARQALESKAKHLAEASRYKSEFLANMSHELRTPLNSLLVLSELLFENDEGNLTDRQIEFAKTIHACGSELLALINDILDLAKIESGKMVVDIKQIDLEDLKQDLERNFCELAKFRKLDFRIVTNEKVVGSIRTDERRLKQVLKNLLSNALKFTETGNVTLLIDQASTSFDRNDASGTEESIISFVVSDTGIGIAKDKQRMIFEPFEQVDGSTSRKYGGTGLGLAISREIATLLGGTLAVESDVGKGSKFTLNLPADYATHPDTACDPLSDTETAEKRKHWSFEGTDTRPSSHECAVADDRCSIHEGDQLLLIIVLDPEFRAGARYLAQERGFKILIAGSCEDGVALAERYLPQAITLDLKLADGQGWTTLELLRGGQKTRQIPVQLVSINGNFSQGTDPHGPAGDSLEQLLGETSMFLDRILKNSPPDVTNLQKKKIARLPEQVFANRTVLVIDDDPKGVFAIKSLLAKHFITVLHAENGRDGLDLLYRNPATDCIVMDVMMPKLDGYDTMRELRKHPQYGRLPIIAVTANAMPGDRVKCLEAGASAYIAKPVDSKQLLSLLRQCLAR